MMTWVAACGAKETGTSKKYTRDTTATEEVSLEEPVAMGDEKLCGTWAVGGFYWESAGVYYRDKLIDIHDDSGLESIYAGVILSFESDGSFVYTNLYIQTGYYEKILDLKNTYLLSVTSMSLFENGELVEKEYSGATQYVVTLLDENTFEFAVYDPIMGIAKANDNPLVFSKYGTTSTYIETNKIDINKITM